MDNKRDDLKREYQEETVKMYVSPSFEEWLILKLIDGREEAQNNVVLPDVNQQRELLLTYERTTQEWEFGEVDEHNTVKKVNEYLSNNCG
ncbi:hypothetical protein OAD61_00640 [bacterium]|nr:hypothetical protein [bacterium]